MLRHRSGHRFGKISLPAVPGKPWSVEQSASISYKNELHEMLPTIIKQLSTSSPKMDWRYGKVRFLKRKMSLPSIVHTVIVASAHVRLLLHISIASTRSCLRKGLTSSPPLALDVFEISTQLGECSSISGIDTMDAGTEYMGHDFQTNPSRSTCQTI